MGLDLVELVLVVEEEFDIIISDGTLENMRTPQDYADYIYDEYQKIDAGRCSSQVGFYKIRKLFIDEFNCKREELKPDTKLEDIFTDNIREEWRHLNELLDNRLKWYPLKLKAKYHLIAFFIALIIGFISQCSIIFLVVWIILGLVFRKYMASIAPMDKLSSLIRFTNESNARTKYKTKDEILDKVIEISIEELGLSPSEISASSRYIEDLGVD